MAERLRTAIHARPSIADGAEIRVTVSIGIATVNIDTTPETLLEAADLALYAAKSGGRNQVRM
jgi:diguanylate cyclase (GGDEF)-like protein